MYLLTYLLTYWLTLLFIIRHLKHSLLTWATSDPERSPFLQRDNPANKFILTTLLAMNLNERKIEDISPDRTQVVCDEFAHFSELRLDASCKKVREKYTCTTRWKLISTCWSIEKERSDYQATSGWFAATIFLQKVPFDQNSLLPFVGKIQSNLYLFIYVLEKAKIVLISL